MTGQPRPPPLPPRPAIRQVSQTVRVTTPIPPGSKLARVHVPDPAALADDEPTEPQGQIYVDRLVLKLFHECAPEDQAYMLKQMEGYADRNRKT
jgi:hypothetical protein